MSAPTRTARRQASIAIAVSPERAYEFVADATHLPEISPECYRCDLPDGSTARAGAVFVGHNRAHNEEWSTVCEVLVAEHSREFAFASGLPDRKLTRWSYAFAPDGPDGTLVTESFEILELPPNLQHAGREQVDARLDELEDGMRMTLVQLKQTLESRPPDRDARVVGPADGMFYRFGDSRMTVKATGPSGATVIEWIAPPGTTAPLHVHHDLDDNLLVLEGELTIWWQGRTARAAAGDYVVLPAGVPHSVLVEGERPLRALLIHASDRFAAFVADVGLRPADAADSPLDPHAVAAAAQRHGQEILGPSPFTGGTR